MTISLASSKVAASMLPSSALKAQDSSKFSLAFARNGSQTSRSETGLKNRNDKRARGRRGNPVPKLTLIPFQAVKPVAENDEEQREEENRRDQMVKRAILISKLAEFESVATRKFVKDKPRKAFLV